MGNSAEPFSPGGDKEGEVRKKQKLWKPEMSSLILIGVFSIQLFTFLIFKYVQVMYELVKHRIKIVYFASIFANSDFFRYLI